MTQLEKKLFWIGGPHSVGNEIVGETPALRPRTFAAFSFLLAYFFDQGLSTRLAKEAVRQGPVEFIETIQTLFLEFLLKAGEPLRAIEFMKLFSDGCKCWEKTFISEQSLAELVAAAEGLTISDPPARGHIGVPCLSSILQVPFAFRSNVAAACRLNAKRYLTFDANERALAAQYGLATDFEEEFPNSP